MIFALESYASTDQMQFSTSSSTLLLNVFVFMLFFCLFQCSVALSNGVIRYGLFKPRISLHSLILHRITRIFFLFESYIYVDHYSALESNSFYFSNSLVTFFVGILNCWYTSFFSLPILYSLDLWRSTLIRCGTVHILIHIDILK